MEFIESPLFARAAADCFSDDEIAILQWHLCEHPDAGDVVPGSGGLRKLRWGVARRGKRGGVRIVYYWADSEDVIWLLTVYSKSKQADIRPDALRRIRKELEQWKSET